MDEPTPRRPSTPDPLRAGQTRRLSPAAVIAEGRWWLRRPLVWWMAAAALTIAAATTTAELTASARRTVERYGTTSQVLIATARIGPGEPIDGRIRVEARPVGHVPDGAVSTVAGTELAVATIVAGEVIVSDRLAGSDSGVGGLLPPGTVGMALPVGAVRPPLDLGDLVDVIATFDAPPAPGAPATTAVARRAVVVDLSDDAVTVAIESADVEPTALAVNRGRLTIALVATG